MDKSQTISAPHWTDPKASITHCVYRGRSGEGCKPTDQDEQISAATRALWLAELSRALQDARRLGAELSQSPALTAESAELAAGVERAMKHVQWLRRGRPLAISEILGPKWIGFSAGRLGPPH